MSREIKNKRSAFRRMTSWEILIFGICGALFPVPYLLSAPWFTVQKNWMLAAAVIPVVVFVIARRFFGKGYWAFLLVFVISFAYVLWRLRYEWGEQFWLMNDRFMGYEEGPDLPDITLFAGFCMVTWAALIMLMEESLAGHLLMCLSILGIVLVMPTIGLNPDAKVGILPALFAAGFFWLHDQKRRIAGKRTARIPASGKKIHIISLWIIVLVAVSYIAGLRIVGRHAEPLFAFIFDVDSRFDRFLDRYRMAGPTGGADEGSISQANCYPTDHEYLQIYADHKPKQDIYLKGFVGASYSDGTWARADETELYKALSRRFGWEESGTRLSGMFENMYYMQNQKVNKKEEKIALAVKRIR
ncbi:MAG: hypothetical protein IJ917_00360, partial [Firmicutes bacterium]|nr:hypothetical protein [Bacillota bacterium]